MNYTIYMFWGMSRLIFLGVWTLGAGRGSQEEPDPAGEGSPVHAFSDLWDQNYGASSYPHLGI